VNVNNSIRFDLVSLEMLLFRPSLVYSLAVQLCLQKLEEASHPHTTIFIPSDELELPKFSKPVLIANPWLSKNNLKQPSTSATNKNSTLFSLISTAAQLSFILALRPQRFAERLFILQLGSLPSAKEILERSGFQGCVQFLESASALPFECPPLECINTVAKEIRLPGFNWPPTFDARHLNFKQGDLIPAEEIVGLTVELHKAVGEVLKTKIVYEMITETNCTSPQANFEFLNKLLDGTLDLIYLPLSTFLFFG